MNAWNFRRVINNKNDNWVGKSAIGYKKYKVHGCFL